ncbi:hypothetical protein WA1_08190 [Scytonema hofmannii PCC 7110]|uniref:Protein kinase domain-containing protein n=1 Tax=Scytonema hofmannii PCC 7110 TaxID=128403 RepID=A0A139WRW4_9CYAN|nr:effector-associated domain EAD1-containing protein [Scytonema hofmannii]KYC35137.1 hypothetical protein WA1_08190 [Scytonema hofmannii PCC 7110]
MSLSGQQIEQLQGALLDAFPDKSSLEQMLSFKLNKNLDTLVEGDASLGTIVFDLIKSANAEGWIQDLICAALLSKPRNSKLNEIARTILCSSSNNTLSLDNILSKDCWQEKYEEKWSLGEGIYTTVSLAINKELSKKVVLKKFHNAGLKDKFAKSIETAFEISTLPNFIIIYDYNISTEPYYVMQYIEGGESLRTYFEENIKLSFKNVLDIILDIGHAMIKARQKAVSPYYLNIKPSKIMIYNKKESFISAFNLCVHLEKKEIFSELDRLWNKDKERLREELAYLLPDKFSSHGVTKQADQYMLGLLAYELITRKIPPSIKNIGNIDDDSKWILLKAGITQGEAFQKISFDNNDVDPEFPGEIKDIILKMTELDPSKRFSNLEEALEIIETYSRFQDTIKTIRLVKESFIRCLRNKKLKKNNNDSSKSNDDPSANKGETSFFESFYDKFRSDPRVDEKFQHFNNLGEKFREKHYKIVERTILVLLWYYEEEKIFNSENIFPIDEKMNFLESIVEAHNNINVSKELFDSFKNALIENVTEYDDKCTEEIHKDLISNAWKKVLEPGFEYIKSKFK